MAEPRDECREVTLPSGELMRVRGAGEMSPEAVAALGELVDAARRMAAEQPVDDGAPELWGRLDAVREPDCLSLRDVAQQAGVRFSTLFRIGQGRMPNTEDMAAIERWLKNGEADESVGS
jgi:hypothetical protein